MRKLGRLSAAALCVSGALSGEAVQSKSIDVPLGPDTYAFSVEWRDGLPFGYEQDVQSFVATESSLGYASLIVREALAPADVFWQFQLWSDLRGNPDQVLAVFGSADPGASESLFFAKPDAPIPLMVGQRYYVGLGPVLGSVPTSGNGSATVEVRGFRTLVGQDAYADGTTWAIRMPGSGGDFQIIPTAFDFSITVGAVPELSEAAMLLAGMALVSGFVARKSRKSRRASPAA